MIQNMNKSKTFMQLKEQSELAEFKKLIVSQPSLEAFVRFGLDHHSPSQLNLPDGFWGFKYLCCNQQERRNFPFTSKPRLGVAIGNAIALMYAHIIWTNNSEKFTNKQINFRNCLRFVQEMLNEYNPIEDKKDLEQHNYHKTIANKFANNLHKAIKSLALTGEIESEANRYLNLETDLDLLMRTDLENDTCVVEIKTLPPRRGKIKKDGTRGFRTQSVTQPKLDAARQTSCYWAATQKRPFLVYVNEKEYKIFDPSNCDLLTEKAMKDHLKFYKSKARTRERLMVQADGDPIKLLGLVSNDFESFYWDIGKELLTKAEGIFKEAQG